jgi:CheY-like chemotaxis protein
MPHRPSVLLVEPSAEEREVLRTVLQQRGLRIFEADEARAGLELAEQHQPDVIVLDLESQSADDEALRDAYDRQSTATDSALVIIGKARRYQRLPAGQMLAKPYHFAPLVHTIEQLAAKAA